MNETKIEISVTKKDFKDQINKLVTELDITPKEAENIKKEMRREVNETLGLNEQNFSQNGLEAFTNLMVSMRIQELKLLKEKGIFEEIKKL